MTSPGQPLVVVDDVDLDPPRPGEVRVKVVACGVCHSDVSLINGTFPSMGPTVCGHEAAGIVVELGDGVTDLVVGDHVILSPVAACGTCAFCRRGLFSVCESSMSIATGTFLDGTTGLSRGDTTVYRGLNVAGWAEEVVLPDFGRDPDRFRPAARRRLRDRLRRPDRGRRRGQHGGHRAGRHRPGPRRRRGRHQHRAGSCHRGSVADHRVRPVRVPAGAGDCASARPT